VRQRFWVRGEGEGGYLEYVERGRRIVVRSEGGEHEVDLSIRPGSPFLHLLVDGRSYPCALREDDDGLVLILRGREHRFEVLSERRKRIRDLGISTDEGARSKNIVAPIPGLVVEIEVEEGEAVQAGQGIVVMEAMKMENELKAPAAGVVRAIRVEKGTPVDQGRLLVEIE
jgi:pyruvate carboxylase subunit B